MCILCKQPKNYQDRKRQKVSGNQTDTFNFKVTWLELFYFSLEKHNGIFGTFLTFWDTL